MIVERTLKHESVGTRICGEILVQMGVHGKVFTPGGCQQFIKENAHVIGGVSYHDICCPVCK